MRGPIIRCCRRGQAPSSRPTISALSSSGSSVGASFSTAAHAREDLLKDTHYYSPDLIDRLTAPGRSLLVAPANGIPSEASLGSSGWSPVKIVREPTGQPVFVIYEKK